MSRRFIEVVVRARRLLSRPPSRAKSSLHVAGGRQVGEEHTQFSFRLAFMIDLVYVGMGALGGAAMSRDAVAPPAPSPAVVERCAADSTANVPPDLVQIFAFQPLAWLGVPGTASAGLMFVPGDGGSVSSIGRWVRIGEAAAASFLRAIYTVHDER